MFKLNCVLTSHTVVSRHTLAFGVDKVSAALHFKVSLGHLYKCTAFDLCPVNWQIVCSSIPASYMRVALVDLNE